MTMLQKIAESRLTKWTAVLMFGSWLMMIYLISNFMFLALIAIAGLMHSMYIWYKMRERQYTYMLLYEVQEAGFDTSDIEY